MKADLFAGLSLLLDVRPSPQTTGLVRSVFLLGDQLAPAARCLLAAGYHLEDISGLDTVEGILVNYHFDDFEQPGRIALRVLAVREDLLVVEDDAYRELSYDGPPPASLWSLAGEVDGADERVVRLGSFSKTLSPGLRCGWLTSGPARVKEFVERGVLDSAGCMSQFGACICARLLEDGVYEANVRRLREAYGARRDALVEALLEHLPAGTSVRRPAGGLFVLVTLPDGLASGDLVGAGEANGVGFSEGTRFSSAGADRGIRLGFSMYAPEELREGAARLGRTIAEGLQRT